MYIKHKNRICKFILKYLVAFKWGDFPAVTVDEYTTLYVESPTDSIFNTYRYSIYYLRVFHSSFMLLITHILSRNLLS